MSDDIHFYLERCRQVLERFQRCVADLIALNLRFLCVAGDRNGSEMGVWQLLVVRFVLNWFLFFFFGYLVGF